MTKRVEAGANPAPEQYRVEGLSRAVQLIEQMADMGEATTESLAKRTHLNAPLVEKIIAVLRDHGLAAGQQNRHRLGLGWLTLAQTREDGLDLRRFATPVMRRIRDRVNETVILAVRSGNRRINIDYVESTQLIRRVTQPGFEVPLHVGATGRILLSGLTEDELDSYLAHIDLRSSMPHGLTAGRLRKECEQARQSGYAVARREITSDTAAVAAAIFDHRGHVAAALTVTCPEDRFTAQVEAACVQALKEGAGRISSLLGYRAPGALP